MSQERHEEVGQEALAKIKELGTWSDYEFAEIELSREVGTEISPIEYMMLAGLYVQPAVFCSRVIVAHQRRVGPALLDFLLHPITDLPNVGLCVEVDGLEWHERSEDQGLRDRQRDRQLLAERGVPTIRFMGSEVYRRPFACGEEAVNCAIKNWKLRGIEISQELVA